MLKLSFGFTSELPGQGLLADPQVSMTPPIQVCHPLTAEVLRPSGSPLAIVTRMDLREAENITSQCLCQQAG